MKQIFHVFRLLLSILAAFMCSAVAVLAQPVSESGKEFLAETDFGVFANTFLLLSFGSAIFTEGMKKGFKAVFRKFPTWATLLLSWAIPISLSGIFWLYSFGVFSHLSILNSLIIGLSCALCSNGVFDSLTILLYSAYNPKRNQESIQ